MAILMARRPFQLVPELWFTCLGDLPPASEGAFFVLSIMLMRN